MKICLPVGAKPCYNREGTAGNAAYKREVETLKKQLEAKQEKIDQAKERILREANEQAREILQDAKNTADETIRAFQKAGPGASMKDLEQARQKLRSTSTTKTASFPSLQRTSPKLRR